MHRTRQPAETLLTLEMGDGAAILRLVSEDNTNRLTGERMAALTEALEGLATSPPPDW